MCLKWDFSGIEGNYATICKQLQIRIISENIFSLILIVYRHRKLGSPLPLFRGRRASPRACYNWQGSRPGPKADRPGLYIRFAVSGLIRRFLCPRGERHERLGKRIENLLVVIVEIVVLRFGIENIPGKQSRNFNDTRPVPVEAGTEVFQKFRTVVEPSLA